MSKQPELPGLKIEIIEQWSHEELVRLVLTQQKLIEKLQQELEKLKERQPSNSFHIIETPIKRYHTEIRVRQS